MNKEKANDYIIPEIEGIYKMKDKVIDKFATCAFLAYNEYPLFKYLTNKNYDYETIKIIIKALIIAMQSQTIAISLNEEIKGISIFTYPGYTGTKTSKFLFWGGIKLIYKKFPNIFFRLLNYENNAMKLKKKVYK